MTQVASSLLSLTVPDVLRPSLERHRANLERLIGNLHAAGMNEAQIESAVTMLVDTYRAELLAAIKALSAQGQAGHDDV